MALLQKRPLRIGVGLVVVVVGLASLVELFGGPEVFGRLQGLAIALALALWFASIAVEEEDPTPRQRQTTRIGLGLAAFLVFAAIVDLII
jgi:hypothetical protein